MHQNNLFTVNNECFGDSSSPKSESSLKGLIKFNIGTEKLRISFLLRLTMAGVCAAVGDLIFCMLVFVVPVFVFRILMDFLLFIFLDDAALESWSLLLFISSSNFPSSSLRGSKESDHFHVDSIEYLQYCKLSHLLSFMFSRSFQSLSTEFNWILVFSNKRIL